MANTFRYPSINKPSLTKALTMQLEEAAASSSPLAQKPASKDPELDMFYYQMVRHGSSIGKYNHKFAKLGLPVPAPNPLTDFSLKSKRMAAIFRLMRQLATVMVGAPSSDDGTRSIQDLFRLVRCQVRFKDTIMQPSAARDAEALIADSDEDKLMIRCIEECSRRVGYVILRALAAIREYGSEVAKGMGLYAILCSNDTLQDFISLVNLLYIDTKLYMQKKYSALIVFKQQANQEALLLQKFARLSITFPTDLDPNPPPYQPRYEWDAFFFADELAQEQKMGEWTDMIRYSRMQKQSILYDKQRPPLGAPEEVNAEAMHIIAKHRNIGIRELQLLCVPGDELQLDDALGAGSPLYRSALDVLQSVGAALKMTGGHDMFKVMQMNFVRRVKFMEVVMLRTAIDQVQAKRSDARNAIMKSSSDLMQASLDFLVMDIFNDK